MRLSRWFRKKSLEETLLVKRDQLTKRYRRTTKVKAKKVIRKKIALIDRELRRLIEKK